MKEKELIQKALEVTGEYRSSDDCTSGGVGAAILTRSGNIYTGVCIDTSCSLGFCAEHAAIADMLKHKESEILMIVAINHDGRLASPCGRCREFIYQVNKKNIDTQVVMGIDQTILLSELLPYRWQESWS